MKLNFFNKGSALYPFRWMIVISVILFGFMIYHDLTGGRMFTSRRSQEQWNSSGPGVHK